MSARVLLISFNRYKRPAAVFPLGLVYIADVVKASGHEVRFVDLNIDGDNWLQSVVDFSPDIVGISVRNVDEVILGHTENLLGELGKLVQQCRTIGPKAVILGGSAISLFPDEILKMSGADYALCGEGEKSFVKIVDDVMRGNAPVAPCVMPSIAASDGGWCRSYDQTIRTHLAPYYLAQSGMLNVQTQRGCPLKCCYCTYPSIEGSHVRRKPVDDVVRELQFLQETGARYFFVTDGVFNSSRSYVMSLCHAMIRGGIKMKWCCFLRPFDIDTEMADTMARAGLAHVEMGSDSLSLPMLKGYGKDFSFSDIVATSARLKACSVKVCHFIIFGGPNETETTVRETFELSRELSGDIFSASIGLRVYPDTPLHRTLCKAGHKFGEINLLNPAFYLSPAFSEESIRALLDELGSMRSEWIMPTMPEGIEKDIMKMRKKGILGPLWDYMELMQRFRNSRLAGLRAKRE